MFRSLRWRLWFSYALVIFIALSIVALAILVFLARDNPQTAIQINGVLNSLVEKQGSTIYRSGKAQDWVERIDESTNIRIIAYNFEGEIIADSRQDLEAPLENLQDYPINNLRHPILLNTDENGKTWKYGARLLENRVLVIASIQKQPIQDILNSNALDDLIQPIFRAGWVALILALVFAYLISRWIAGPLQHMSEAVDGMAKGQKTKVELKGPKEVQDLGLAFNEMSQQVSASQQSQRDFVANVSHELKTPLTSIQGFAQAILDGTANDPKSLENSAQVIFDESGRMHRLVVDLLDLAKLDAGTSELDLAPVNLEILLSSVLEKFIPQAKLGKIKISSDINPMPLFLGDGDRLAQVFTNLVDNAIKYTPEGGDITLKTEQTTENIRISVIDTGEGIPPEEVDRIFERFYQIDKARTREDDRGVGLGLAIAEQIVRGHGGKMMVISEEEKGSRFIVDLPIE
ncbi:MAG: HAMP domain-containing protein [Chloroflexi bacterium]|jgi:signal transduction histidine kinase|nr:HAMP domain-containing protein [Chloroflexota bacterium]MBT3670930.1 HAMP domain-containing protein [Chloroflexota bacterium]MBT4003402.1 HAMP domain-containing protein [Chloroflexota bacterium]MBT4306356.1 HAMP domain-containing protein [Chloroflexota bacterium]MBT4532763.1 HAMP domain-containing protein [Chloroflexota bacterium]